MPRKKPQLRPPQHRPITKRPGIDELFPALAKWVQTHGWIEVGDQESVGFVARALDYGGLIIEDRKAKTLAGAMAVLERKIMDHLEREKM